MLLSRGSPGTIWKAKRSQTAEAASQRSQGQKQECPRERPGQRGTSQKEDGEAKPARSPHLPVVEDRQGKGLSLGMSTKVCLEAKRVDGWDESFNGVERGAWYGCILSYVTPEKDKGQGPSCIRLKARGNLWSFSMYPIS